MNDWKIHFTRTYRSLNGRPGGKDGIPVKYDMNVIEQNELYNLKDDPGQRINLVKQEKEKFLELKEIYSESINN